MSRSGQGLSLPRRSAQAKQFKVSEERLAAELRQARDAATARQAELQGQLTQQQGDAEAAAKRAAGQSAEAAKSRCIHTESKCACLTVMLAPKRVVCAAAGQQTRRASTRCRGSLAA